MSRAYETWTAYDLEEEDRYVRSLIIGFGTAWMVMLMGAIMYAVTAGVIS